jgi:hypothetical protein
MWRPLKLQHLPFGSILFDGAWLKRGLLYVDIEFQKSRQCFLRKADNGGFIVHEVYAATQEGLHISPRIRFSKIDRLHDVLFNGATGTDNLETPDEVIPPLGQWRRACSGLFVDGHQGI